MSGLIDTTEMYLKTVFEFIEEGVPSLRARIVERLGQSGPTVSETVARIERDGLLEMPDGKHVAFTAKGNELANKVMRRHRIAECFMREILKMPLAKVHAEACRWEHAISDDVANRMMEFLNNPKVDPFGNSIPAAVDGPQAIETAEKVGLCALSAVKLAENEPKKVKVVRFAESLQLAEAQISLFVDAGFLPSVDVLVRDFVDDEVFVDVGAEKLALSLESAVKIFVRV